MRDTLNTTSHKIIAPYIAYVLIFHGVWVGWAYVLYPWLQTLGAATLQYALVTISLRLLIWVLPVFWYLRYVDHVEPIAYLKLRQHWKRGVLVGLVVTIINAGGSLLRFGVPHLNLHAITWNDLLSTSLLIGLIEEIPYRGFLLRKFQERFPFWAANLIASLLFVTIHLPGWLALHLFRIETAVTLFIFALVMSLLVYYSRSLWSAIVTHSLNDFLTVVVFHL